MNDKKLQIPYAFLSLGLAFTFLSYTATAASARSGTPDEPTFAVIVQGFDTPPTFFPTLVGANLLHSRARPAAA